MSNNLNPFHSGNNLGRRTSVFGSIRNRLSRSKTNELSGPGVTSTRTINGNNTSDPPPAYSPQAYAPIPNTTSSKTTSGYDAPALNNTTSNYAANNTQAAQDDDPCALLATFDTILLIDDSGSMSGSESNGPTRWQQTLQALQSIAPTVTEYDTDGIDIYFMNTRNDKDKGNMSEGIAPGGWRGITSGEAVVKIFKSFAPHGLTPTGRRISQILGPYLTKMEKEIAKGGDAKPVNLIVITDGAATDEPDQEIIRIAKRLDKANAPLNQVGIQFFQVGDDKAATAALKSLDDDLVKRDVRDMVDTVTWNGRDTTAPTLSAESILKTVLGAVNRRLDEQRTSGDSGRSGRR